MPLDWMDVSSLSFNTLLLLEQVQLGWLPGWMPEREMAVALRANPTVEWFMRHKCPSISGWLDRLMAALPAGEAAGPAEARRAEVAVLSSMVDLVVYAVDPAVYDAQPFLRWDSQELLSLADFAGKTVVDVGAGTGRLTLAVAGLARTVFAVEPVANLRAYLKQKTRARGWHHVYPVDGLITDIPLPDATVDVTIGGHVFGDLPDQEYRELRRVTRPGGTIILCPGNGDKDDEVHSFLVDQGFAWSRFEQPGEGPVRKYWQKVAPEGGER